MSWLVGTSETEISFDRPFLRWLFEYRIIVFISMSTMNGPYVPLPFRVAGYIIIMSIESGKISVCSMDMRLKLG